jgi:hypothetical protein
MSTRFDTGFADNTTIGDAIIDWLFNPLYGNLHLSIVAPISVTSAATWSQGDPLADFDATHARGQHGLRRRRSSALRPLRGRFPLQRWVAGCVSATDDRRHRNTERER